MLFSKILLSKLGFLKKTGETCIDLTKSSYNRNLVNSTDVQVIKTTEEHIMRADLVSQTAYQDQTLWDGILKFNGISNPFSIDINQILLIPTAENLELGYKNSVTILDIASNKRVNQVLNPVTKQDSARLSMLSSKPIPNNIVDTTDKNVKVKDGRIIFGEDVTTVQKERCTGSVSRAKLKEKLLQNQIFE